MYAYTTTDKYIILPEKYMLIHVMYLHLISLRTLQYGRIHINKT